MRALLLYPRFPMTFWSFEGILELVNRRALMPPLSLITVAALLPQEWELRLVDCNVEEPGEKDWDWAEIVLISAMIVQRPDCIDKIQEAKSRGKIVAVGGPYPTSLPSELKSAGADFLVLDEGELTVPSFLESVVQGSTEGVFRSLDEKPDITRTPVPRFDLLGFSAYDMMAVQFSRGCPFLCEFCDIITLYGRRPRTKKPDQMLSELNTLLELGWRRGVFVVDDNFVGNKRNAAEFLRELKKWQHRRGFPFRFTTEASIDLSKEPELIGLMAESGFDGVFIGIETPDTATLHAIKKHQNVRVPMAEGIDTLVRAGLRPMAGFIIGFDGEAPGAGDRIVEFVEETAVPTVFFSMLQALPTTPLWDRMKQEGRLLDVAAMNQTDLTNFIPTRPVEELADEYIAAFWKLYEPEVYLDRVYRCFAKMGRPVKTGRFRLPLGSEIVASVRDLGAFLRVVWRQGIRRSTRWRFWMNLGRILLHNRSQCVYYLTVCAHYEHFSKYRESVRDSIQDQIRERVGIRKAEPSPAEALGRTA